MEDFNFLDIQLEMYIKRFIQCKTRLCPVWQESKEKVALNPAINPIRYSMNRF
jgi:hypothetical protein